MSGPCLLLPQQRRLLCTAATELNDSNGAGERPHCRCGRFGTLPGNAVGAPILTALWPSGPRTRAPLTHLQSLPPTCRHRPDETYTLEAHLSNRAFGHGNWTVP